MKRTKSTYAEHKEKMSALNRAGLSITQRVGTMWCAIFFCVLAIISLPAALQSHSPIIIVAWIAQTFLQLVLLPIIMVGQNLQNAHTELQAQADFETNIEAEKRVEELQNTIGFIENEKLDAIMTHLGITIPYREDTMGGKVYACRLKIHNSMGRHVHHNGSTMFIPDDQLFVKIEELTRGKRPRSHK